LGNAVHARVFLNTSSFWPMLPSITKLHQSVTITQRTTAAARYGLFSPARREVPGE